MEIRLQTNNKYEIFKSILFIISAFILQLFLVPLIEVDIWRPDLILIITLLIAYKFGVISGTLVGFGLGIFQDALSASPIGISSMANCIVGFLGGNFKNYKFTSYMKVLMTILLMLIHGIIFYAIYQFKTDTSYVNLILTRVFPNTIYTLILWLVTSFLFKPFPEE